MSIDQKFSDLMEMNGRYWYGHQSPLTCLLGSDGVGHDYIHPADQLQAACRNAHTVYEAIQHLQEESELKKIELEDMMHKSQNYLSGVEAKKTEVLIRRTKRAIDSIDMQIRERAEAFNVYHKHAMALREWVSARYQHIDEALPEISASKLAYSSAVKSMPLGHDFKVALMTEDQKRAVYRELGLPSEWPMPDAKAILNKVNSMSKELRALPTENKQIEGGNV